jgi:plastocyanin
MNTLKLKRQILSFLFLAGLCLPLSVIAAIHEITVNDFNFRDANGNTTTTIQVGDTVRWINAAGGAQHNVTSSTGAFEASPTANSFEIERTFDSVGTFNYFCSLHSNMTGSIIVEEAAAVFNINAGLNDAWVSDDAPFQGLFFTVFEDLGFFFLSWFTFDSVAPGAGATATFGAADQRWVTGGGLFSGDSVTVNVELTSGGIFNASEPLATQETGYGTITVMFISCNEALLTYNFPAVGLSGQMTLHRVVTDNVALCEMLAAP